VKIRDGYTYTQIPFQRDVREHTTWKQSTSLPTTLRNASGGCLLSRTNALGGVE
jgi:hypothetical protein